MTHVPGIEPTAKMDTPEGLYRGVCSCSWHGGADSPKGAAEAARQHAEAKNNPGRPTKGRKPVAVHGSLCALARFYDETDQSAALETAQLDEETPR